MEYFHSEYPASPPGAKSSSHGTLVSGHSLNTHSGPTSSPVAISNIGENSAKTTSTGEEFKGGDSMTDFLPVPTAEPVSCCSSSSGVPFAQSTRATSPDSCVQQSCNPVTKLCASLDIDSCESQFYSPTSSMKQSYPEQANIGRNKQLAGSGFDHSQHHGTSRSHLHHHTNTEARVSTNNITIGSSSPNIMAGPGRGNNVPENIAVDHPSYSNLPGGQLPHPPPGRYGSYTTSRGLTSPNWRVTAHSLDAPLTPASPSSSFHTSATPPTPSLANLQLHTRISSLNSISSNDRMSPTSPPSFSTSFGGSIRSFPIANSDTNHPSPTSHLPQSQVQSAGVMARRGGQSGDMLKSSSDNEGDITTYAYCLNRGNGQFTRLIPADMLPPLKDIPALQQGCIGMKVLETPVGLAPNGRSSNFEPVSMMPSTSEPSTSLVAMPDSIQSRIDSIVGTSPTMGSATPGSGSAPKRVKIYCDKWVHEGVCAFTQQGCKYRHEMPYDRFTQHSLGLFHGFPPWWRKHQAELSRTKNSSTVGVISNNQDSGGGGSPATVPNGDRGGAGQVLDVKTESGYRQGGRSGLGSYSRGNLNSYSYGRQAELGQTGRGGSEGGPRGVAPQTAAVPWRAAASDGRAQVAQFHTTTSPFGPIAPPQSRFTSATGGLGSFGGGRYPSTAGFANNNPFGMLQELDEAANENNDEGAKLN